MRFVYFHIYQIYFRCKFCEKIMDKDVYGVHLRQHLATERRKANTNATSTLSSSQASNSATSEQQNMNKSSAR